MLGEEGVFAVGTQRSTLRGASDAKAWFMKHSTELSESVLRETGGMVFVRFRDVAFTFWKYSKGVLFISTIHIYQIETTFEVSGTGKVLASRFGKNV